MLLFSWRLRSETLLNYCNTFLHLFQFVMYGPWFILIGWMLELGKTGTFGKTFYSRPQQLKNWAPVEFYSVKLSSSVTRSVVNNKDISWLPSSSSSTLILTHLSSHSSSLFNFLYHSVSSSNPRGLLFQQNIENPFLMKMKTSKCFRFTSTLYYKTTLNRFSCNNDLT